MDKCIYGDYPQIVLIRRNPQIKGSLVCTKDDYPQQWIKFDINHSI